MKIAVTGATGFVAQHLLASLLETAAPGTELVALSRGTSPDGSSTDSDQPTAKATGSDGLRWVNIADIAQPSVLWGADVVVHAAGRAHQPEQTGVDSWPAFERDNVQLTETVTHAAIAAGVRRIIYLSSVKALGEATSGRPLAHDARPQPEDNYGRSKLQAEQRLAELCRNTETDWVVIRPPLIYGPGVKANFRRLLSLATLPVPLPLGSVKNQRDLVSIYNLCDLIRMCMTNPAAAGQVFMVSDGRPYALSELIIRARRVMGRRGSTFPAPVGWLKSLLNRGLGEAACHRLLGDLEVDIEATRTRLGWRPRHTYESTLARMLSTGERRDQLPPAEHLVAQSGTNSMRRAGMA